MSFSLRYYGLSISRQPLKLPRKKNLRHWIGNWRKIFFLLKSGEFDGSWYLSQYQDVNSYYEKKKIWKYRYKKNPLLRLIARMLTNACVHYVTKGVYMGYSPNASFDTCYYMDHNEDLCKIAELNPFVHYLCFGKKEGRACGVQYSLTNAWYKDFANIEHNVGISIVTSSKTFIPLQEDDYETYDIEVIESREPYMDSMNKCHKEVVWFLETHLDSKLFHAILQNRKYFVDSAVFAVCSQGTKNFFVASSMTQIDGFFPSCIYFEMNTLLLRKTEHLNSEEKNYSFNAFAHTIIKGKKIAFTNASGLSLREMTYEEYLSVYNALGRKWDFCGEEILNVYPRIRNAALQSDISLNDWKKEDWLNKMVAGYQTSRILISIYAFSYGGGEIMPIRLANTLFEKGYQVGVHVYNAKDYHADVRSLLNSSIPVIYADTITSIIPNIEKLGYNVINSHHQACQSFIDHALNHNEHLQKQVIHIGTSHGIYEHFEPDTLKHILLNNGMANRISYWTYVADKNVTPFKQLNVYDKERFIKIPNGMKIPQIKPYDLSKYRIKKDDFVITIISRAIMEKGWLHAIHAVEKLHDSHPEIHLLLVGNGELYDKYAEKMGNDYIHFLGFQKNACDIFAASDLCLLPSYYPSESAPLCLIEAMMCSIPSIATDIGDIREMLTDSETLAGKIISLKENRVDENELANAILEMIENKNLYNSAARAAKHKSRFYEIDTVAEHYLDVYKKGLNTSMEEMEQFDKSVQRLRQTDIMLWNAKQCLQTPKVSVIVPNYNHSKFLRQRLDSIYKQTYQNLEVILMDDCSTDNSREILEEYAAKYPAKTKLLFNEENSGGVFHQWMKGIRNATGELCWIAESDDYCEYNFLETLVPEFQDETIQLAYTKYVFVDENGKTNENACWNYVGKVNNEKWRHSYRNTSIQEISDGLGIINTIPNASGAIFRNPGELPLFSDSDWYQMKICGDWIFYLHLLKNKSLAYNVGTTSYFRFHSQNSSRKTYTQPVYYKEHGQVAKVLWNLYSPDDEIMSRQKEMVWNFYQQNVGNNKQTFEKWFDFSCKTTSPLSGLKKTEQIISKNSEAIFKKEAEAPSKILFLNPIIRLKDCTSQDSLEYHMQCAGNNTGNQVFIEAVRQQVHINGETWTHAEKIKSFSPENTVAVMPCANYIIEGPMPYIHVLTDMYICTNIPIVPIGLGAQSSQAGNTPRKLVRRLSQHVITWLKIASEQTVSLGIRGNFTAECLDLLGIHNYRVIGCPSLYHSLDGNFPILPAPSAKKTLFTTTAKSNEEAKLLQMAINSNSKWIYQMMTEYPEILYNDEYPDAEILKLKFPGLNVKPQTLKEYVMKNANIFFNMDEWNTYLQKEQFTFAYGSRFHGNMMALRNGIPALWITHDSRTEELTDTLHLPHISIEQAIKYRTPKKLIPYCDYTEFYKAWPKLVHEYVSFLEENHINHKFTL